MVIKTAKGFRVWHEPFTASSQGIELDLFQYARQYSRFRLLRQQAKKRLASKDKGKLCNDFGLFWSFASAAKGEFLLKGTIND